jgi:hypothetical protein
MVTETVRRWVQGLRTAFAASVEVTSAAPLQQRSDRLELIELQPVLFSLTSEEDEQPM